MSKCSKCRLRAIVGTCKSLRGGLFPYKDKYHGARLFAVYHGPHFLEAFPSQSDAKKFVKDHVDLLHYFDLSIVLMEAK